MKRTLGVCYYPEHWPEAVWAEDARRMAGLGLTWVRIGEFAWSHLERVEGVYTFDWLDRAIEVLGNAGLQVVLGTPTATPPRWVVDKHPDMLPLNEQGRARGFGSRRHYCFSHPGFQAEAARIVTRLAERYCKNPHVAAWQTDNEYGCHDTTLSYSASARNAFRTWLRARYPGDNNAGDIDALNAAWGNVFWSMEYDDFDQIELPNLTVTEPNPAHALAFRRFASDQVVAFNRIQTDIIRAYSDAPIAHNYMGKVTEFDHFATGADLDIASWDSYPIGFLEDRVRANDAFKKRYATTGDPDFQAFHHDLYRAVGRGRWWIMEQQPGPVNWAAQNPAPAPGMVRLWTWEAFAHGAEAVCYFRWRQAPFAQEQMHAGLLRPDSAEAQAFAEATQVAQELADAPEAVPTQADVALLFDYASDWAWTVQPHGAGLCYFDLVFDIYRGLRALGLSIDILPPDTGALTDYKLILAPGMMLMDDALKSRFLDSGAEVMMGPRSAARDADMMIPVPLPPAMPGLDVTVDRVESLRADMPVALKGGGAFTEYFEHLEGAAEVALRTEIGTPAVMRAGQISYLAGWPDAVAARRVLSELCARAGVDTYDLPDGFRCRDTGSERFWFNYTDTPLSHGAVTVPAHGVVRETLG